MTRLVILLWLWLTCCCGNVDNFSDKVCPTEGRSVDNGTNVVLHVNCSSSQPVVGYSVTDHSGFAAIGAVTVEYTCTNASGYILADEVLAAISSAPGFSRTASLPRSFETGVQCTFSGCYNTATLGLVAGRTQLVLQPTPCVVGLLPAVTSSEEAVSTTTTTVAPQPCIHCSSSNTTTTRGLDPSSVTDTAGTTLNSRTMEDLNTAIVSETKGSSFPSSIILPTPSVDLLPSTRREQQASSSQPSPSLRVEVHTSLRRDAGSVCLGDCPSPSPSNSRLPCANCGISVVMVSLMWVGGTVVAVFIVALAIGGVIAYACKERNENMESEKRHSYLKSEWDEELNPNFHPVSTDVYPSSFDVGNWESIPSLFNTMDSIPSLFHSKSSLAGADMPFSTNFDPSLGFNGEEHSIFQSESLWRNSAKCSEVGGATSLMNIHEEHSGIIRPSTAVSKSHDTTRRSHDFARQINAVNDLAQNRNHELENECTTNSAQHVDNPITVSHRVLPPLAMESNKQTLAAQAFQTERPYSVDELSLQSPSHMVHSHRPTFVDAHSLESPRRKVQSYRPDFVDTSSPQSHGYTPLSPLFTDESGAFLTDSEGYVCLQEQTLLS